jgi:hypothetical protein
MYVLPRFGHSLDRIMPYNKDITLFSIKNKPNIQDSMPKFAAKCTDPKIKK